MAVKHFLDNILLLEVYRFEEFSNQYKNDGMVTIIQIARASNNLKNLLIYITIDR